MTANTQPAQMNALIEAEPDLVDRIFEYLLTEVPSFAEQIPLARLAQLKHAARSEFAGDRVRVSPRTEAGRRDQVAQVLQLFNGRNAREVARRLGISRPTVYRILKQAGPSTQNSLTPGRNETPPGVCSFESPSTP